MTTTPPSDFDWQAAFKAEQAMNACPSFSKLLGETTMRIADAVVDIKTSLLLDVLFERQSMDGVRCVEEHYPSGKTRFAVHVHGQPVSPWWRWGFVGLTFHVAPADSEVWNKRPAW